MAHKLVNIGFGNSVVSRRVVAIISPSAAPIKRLRDEAREEKRLIDATQGRKTRSVIVTDSNHVILSAIQSETIAQRFSPDYRLNKEDLEECPCPVTSTSFPVPRARGNPLSFGTSGRVSRVWAIVSPIRVASPETVKWTGLIITSWISRVSEE